MNDKDLNPSKNEAEAPGWFSKWFPHVSKLAWSTLDLTNLYVKIPLLFNFKIFHVIYLQICMTIIVGDSILWNVKTKSLSSQEIKATAEGNYNASKYIEDEDNAKLSRK